MDVTFVMGEFASNFVNGVIKFLPESEICMELIGGIILAIMCNQTLIIRVLLHISMLHDLEDKSWGYSTAFDTGELAKPEKRQQNQKGKAEQNGSRGWNMKERGGSIQEEAFSQAKG